MTEAHDRRAPRPRAAASARRSLRRGRGMRLRGRIAVVLAVTLAVPVLGGAAAGAQVLSAARAQGPLIMFVGDSVPHALGGAFTEEATRRGWRVDMAAIHGCNVSGDRLGKIEGGVPEYKPLCVHTVHVQDQMIRDDDPDLVVWWDRFDVDDFITYHGKLVRRGTPKFFHYRAPTLGHTVARLGRDGARIVFVATEPVGQAFPCPGPKCSTWRWFQVRHNEAFTQWNAIRRGFARAHPDAASFITFIDQVCHDDAVPCDDTYHGKPARPDGVHYGGDGKDLAVRLLADRLAKILGG